MAAAVPALVDMAHDPGEVVEAGAASEQVGAGDGAAPDDVALGRRERARGGEEASGNREAAGMVEDRHELGLGGRHGVEAQAFGHATGRPGEPVRARAARLMMGAQLAGEEVNGGAQPAAGLVVRGRMELLGAHG
jgi:hypothetical protein